MWPYLGQCPFPGRFEFITRLPGRHGVRLTAIGQPFSDGFPDGREKLIPVSKGFYIVARALETTPERVAGMAARGELRLR